MKEGAVCSILIQTNFRPQMLRDLEYWHVSVGPESGSMVPLAFMIDHDFMGLDLMSTLRKRR